MSAPKSIEFPNLSLSELEFVRMNNPNVHAQLIKMRKAIVAYAEKCSWCDGTGQDNDGESFVNEPCRKCKELWESLT